MKLNISKFEILFSIIISKICEYLNPNIIFNKFDLRVILKNQLFLYCRKIKMINQLTLI